MTVPDRRGIVRAMKHLPALVLAASVLVLPGCGPPRGHSTAQQDGPGKPLAFSREIFFAHALSRNADAWRTVAHGDPPPGCGIRWIYDYALLLAESGEPRSRIDRLLRLGESMQDRDPESPTFGNFRWYWRTGTVTDRNAVEFVAHHLIPLWILHRDALAPPVRAVLERTLRRAVDGCLRHEVPPSYTNIAISNAVNLVLLGERLGRDDAVAEGRRRLEAVCGTTRRQGICEYDSPTYYGVDLDMLVLLDRHVRDARARRAGEALLELFWTDLAVNWFAPAQRLAGTHSRSYNYPCGASDFLDRHLAHAGWTTSTFADWIAEAFLDSPERRFLDGMAWIDAMPGPWRPPARLREIMETRYPRDVWQRFGPRKAHWRRHLVYPDITLGCSGKGYGVMDLPLTVDLPGGRAASRCYFIADGREDPYGKRKFAVGAAGHTKALHLGPLWAAASGGDEALAVALYPDSAVDEEHVTNLQSHFVVRKPDALFIDGAPRAVERNGALSLAVGSVVVLRYGTAALAVSVPWAVTRGRTRASVCLVDDGNPHGVLRVTVEHFGTGGAKRVGAGTPFLPGAAIWVRIGSRLDGARFETWLEGIGRPVFMADDRTLRFTSTAGGDGVRLVVDNPWEGRRAVRSHPAPPEGILSLNGKELGRAVLAPLGPLPATP